MSEDSFSFLRSFDLVLAGQDVRTLRLPVPNALSGQVSLISIFLKKCLKILNIHRLKSMASAPKDLELSERERNSKRHLESNVASADQRQIYCDVKEA